MKRLLTAVIFIAASTQLMAQELGDPQAGLTSAKQYCSGCHGVSAEKSPLPEATSFKEVAQIPGVTAATFIVWMKSSHPTMPNIVLEPHDLRNIIAYILSLKDEADKTP